jgi:hypothetical protein
MTRPEKRQEKRAQEQELKMKELKVKGFNFAGAGVSKNTAHPSQSIEQNQRSKTA